MARVLSFNDFLNESIDKSSKEIESSTYQAVTDKLWGGMFKSTYLTNEEKTWLNDLMVSENIAYDENTNLSESLWNVLKKGYEKVKNSAVGKSVVDKIGKLMDNAKAFASYMADLFKKAFNKILEYFKKKYDKARETIVADYKKGKEGAVTGTKNLTEEVKQLKETSLFWLKEFPNLIVDSIKNKFTKEIVKECLTFNGDLLNELKTFDPAKMISEQDGDNLPATTDKEDNADGVEIGLDKNGEQKGLFSFLNKITHTIEKVPPFSLLHKIKHIAEAGAKKVLNKFSELTNKMGGPGVYDFVAISAIAGALIEYYIKHLGLGGAEEIMKGEAIMRFLPGATDVIHTIELIALVVVTIDTVNQIVEVEQEIAKGGDEAGAA